MATGESSDPCGLHSDGTLSSEMDVHRGVIERIDGKVELLRKQIEHLRSETAATATESETTVLREIERMRSEMEFGLQALALKSEQCEGLIAKMQLEIDHLQSAHELLRRQVEDSGLASTKANSAASPPEPSQGVGSNTVRNFIVATFVVVGLVKSFLGYYSWIKKGRWVLP